MTGRDKQKNEEGRKQKAVLTLLAVFFVLGWHMPAAHAASLIGVSSVPSIQQGESVPIEWYLDTEGAIINAVDLTLVFSSDTLEVAAEPGRSLVSLWVEPPTARNAEGVVTLVGGIPGGLSGVVPLFRTNVTGRAAGPAVFALSASSKAYLHDGSGTPVAIELPQFQLAVGSSTAAFARSSTHPDQEQWYRAQDVKLAFPYDASASYRYTFTQDFNRFPDGEAQETDGSLTYTDLADGVYFFRVVETGADGAATDKGVFRVQIDRTPPEAFTPLLATSTDLFDGKPFLSFATVDKTSGITRYEVRSGWFGRSREARSPYAASRPLLGDSVRVRAYDAAGNSQDAYVSYPGVIGTLTLITILAVLGVILGIGIRYSRKKRLLP